MEKIGFKILILCLSIGMVMSLRCSTGGTSTTCKQCAPNANICFTLIIAGKSNFSIHEGKCLNKKKFKVLQCWSREVVEWEASALSSQWLQVVLKALQIFDVPNLINEACCYWKEPENSITYRFFHNFYFSIYISSKFFLGIHS